MVIFFWFHFSTIDAYKFFRFVNPRKLPLSRLEILFSLCCLEILKLWAKVLKLWDRKKWKGNACPYMVVGSSNPLKTRALLKPVLFSDKSLDKRNLIIEKPILKNILGNLQAVQTIIVVRDRFCNHSSSFSLLYFSVQLQHSAVADNQFGSP